MFCRRLKSPVFISALFIILSLSSSAFALDMASKRDCVICHVMWSNDFRTTNETMVEFQPGNVLMKDTQGVVSSEDICYSCHDGYVQDSRYIVWKYKRHKVFVKPSENVTIPPEMPLSSKGELYCGTCHSAHGKGAASHGDPTGRTSMYRERNVDSSLCEKCHSSEADYDRSNGHPLHKVTDMKFPQKLFWLGSKEAVDKNRVICQSCHMVHGARGDKLLIVENKNSELCLICHENKEQIINTKHDIRLTMPDEKNIKNQPLSESGPCGACHTPHNAAGEKMWAKPLREGNPATELCRTCHNDETGHEIAGTGEFSHPVNIEVSPGDKKRSELPLFADGGGPDPDGKVQCFTCHDVHTWDPESPDNRGGRDVEGDSMNSFLRVSNASSALCMECHSDKIQILASDHNLEATCLEEKNVRGANANASGPCGACHIPHNAESRLLWAKKLSGEKDFMSQLCTGCHNKNGAARDKLAGDYYHSADPVSGNPVVDTSLPLYDSEGNRTADGKVTCATCHDPHTWDPSEPRPVINHAYENQEGDSSNSFLRVSNVSSTLCIECHSDKKQVMLSDHNLEVTAPEEKNVQGLNASASGPCGACHIPHNAASDRLWAKKLSGDRDFVTEMCSSCHNKTGPAQAKIMKGNNHPVNVAPEKINIDSPLPLFDSDGKQTAGGKIVCATCHDPHTWDPEKPVVNFSYKNEEGDASNSFLRRANFPLSNLCESCHKEQVLVSGTEHDLNVTAPLEKNFLDQTVKESGQCGVCHLVHNSPEGLKLWARPYGPVYPGDNVINALCTSCHVSGGIAGDKRPFISNHPDNILISNILHSDRKAVNYMPIYDKEGKEIRVGDIACPSCHNVHQWKAGSGRTGPGQNTEGNSTNSFLRNISYNNICVECHGFDALSKFKYFHNENKRTEKISK